MDDRRFDALTRTIAADGWTRRHALRGAAAGAMATLLVLLEQNDVGAACVKPGKKGCKGPQKKSCCPGATCKGGNTSKPGRCVCKPGRTKCGPACVNIKASAQHCGGCNKPCGAGQTCQGGTCVGGGGECTPGCTGGRTCQGGTCACPAGTENSCDSAVAGDCYCCPSGQFHCGGGACHECCIGADCGGGGRFCGQGNICRCPNQQEDCNGICKTCCTTAHCQAQGSEQYICTDNGDGANICACNTSGWQGCPKPSGVGYYCPDLANDESNCGQCGRNCLGWNCIDGVCTQP